MDAAGRRAAGGAVLGAVVGFGLGAAVYAGLAPALEAAGPGWSELQGFAWNAVPMGTIAGGVLGGVMARRGPRSRQDS